MRLWSLHPRYLDAKGLVALWREALLAQAVLGDRTRGYRNHPQLDRFRTATSPAAAIGAYLREVWLEAQRRGYTFDGSKVGRARRSSRLAVTRGQLRFEWKHLAAKLEVRAPGWRTALGRVGEPAPHPLFDVVDGPVEPWERTEKRGSR